MYFVQKIADAAEVLIELDMRLSRWVSNHGIHDFNALAAQAISDDYGKELTEHLMYRSVQADMQPTNRTPRVAQKKESQYIEIMQHFNVLALGIGTEGRNRTDMSISPLDFESSASTSFTTPAYRKSTTD